MTWLHTWMGLLVGWVLFFVFLTGTFGYVNAEVDRWMRPEQPVPSAFPPTVHLAAVAEQRLREHAGNADLWQIVFPGDRGATGLSVRWRARSAGDDKPGTFARETLDPETGAPDKHRARDTGGGMTLYIMHYALHYMPPPWGYYLVGACSMFMLTAIFTGIVAHKKIFKDFFTFRPMKGQRSWLDGHNLLAVAALPFHLMITWSGLVFFFATYLPVAIAVLYPEGAAREGFFAETYGIERIDRSADRPSAPLVSLASLLAQAEALWGADMTASIIVDNPGRDNARVTFHAREENHIGRTKPFLRFDGATGTLLERGTGAPTAAGRFNDVLLSLHEGRFAGPVLRLLYVLAGLAGTAMVGTGLVLWSTKRKAKLRATARPHFGIAVVDVLNLGTVIGLPIGIAAYFWANRLLPVAMEGRAAWEVHAMFVTWAVTFLYVTSRPRARAWIELASLAAAAWGLLPLLNALTTDRHLGVTLPAGDWALAAIDLGMLAAGLFFAGLAWTMRRKLTKGAEAPMRRATLRAGTLSERTRHRWSVASRALAAAGGGYVTVSLFSLAIPLLLAALGGDRAQALLAVSMAGFPLYAAIIMAVFHARSATRAWAWLAGVALPLGIIVWLLLPGSPA